MTKFPYPEVLLLLFEEAAESCPGKRTRNLFPTNTQNRTNRFDHLRWQILFKISSTDGLDRSLGTDLFAVSLTFT